MLKLIKDPPLGVINKNQQTKHVTFRHLGVEFCLQQTEGELELVMLGMKMQFLIFIVDVLVIFYIFVFLI